MFCILFLAPTVTPVNIGLQMTEYSVIEPEDYQFVCAEVQSGDVAGRDIEIDFVVEDSGIVTKSRVVLQSYLYVLYQMVL